MSAIDQKSVLEQKAAILSQASVANLFRLRLGADARRPAARRKVDGKWQVLTWEQLAQRGEELSWGLMALGVKPGDMVSLIGSTRVEWALCDLAVMHASGIAVPIYHSNTPEEIRFILDNSGAVLVFAENAVQLKKLQEIKARVPKVQRVVLMEGAGAPGDEWVLSLQQLTEAGTAYKAQHPDEMRTRLLAQKREDLHTILYTSGTTGVPKGVMITNDNMLFGAEATVISGLLSREDSHLLFLPFAHSFAQLIKCAWYGTGMTQIFAESVEKLVDNASESGPTMLAAVPRVFEKAFNNVIAAGLSQPGLKGGLFKMAMSEFESYAQAKDKGEDYSSLLFTVAKLLVFPKIEAKLRARFGGHLRAFVSGGAPLAKKIAYFFDLLNFMILEGYGLTETTAVTSANLPGAIKLGTVGRAFADVQVKIASDGEILEKSRAVMRGYLGLAEATAEVVDGEGWFHTGDIGELDKDGFIRITDRKKDLIKTSGGKYIAPQAIEGALKTMSELISQVVVIGDTRKYVSVLLTVVEDVAKKVASEAGEPAGDYAGAARSKAVKAKVQAAIDKLNANVASYESIKRFTILERDFSQDTGELTPTLKVKRKYCTQTYKAQIDAMYADENRMA